MCLHGSPGLHDGLIQWFSSFSSHGFGVIAPSRPGYGRTNIEIGKSYADQADCFAALLDHLKIDKVSVYGISGGGPAAIQFAARYPKKCSVLLTECAVTGEFVHDKVEMVNKYGSIAFKPSFFRMIGYMARNY